MFRGILLALGTGLVAMALPAAAAWRSSRVRRVVADASRLDVQALDRDDDRNSRA
jgi:hypothetical protein